jgi:small-conductance mechanosensitive channel
MNDSTLRALIADIVADANRTQIYWQVLALVLIALLAALAARAIHSLLGGKRGAQPSDPMAGAHPRILFPIFAGVLSLAAAHIAEDLHRHADLARVTALLLLALGAIRVASYMTRRVFKVSSTLIMLQRLFATTIWILLALHLTGFLPSVIRAFEIPIYGSVEAHDLVTLLQLVKAALGVCAALLAALWAGGAIDARLDRVESLDSSLRVATSRFTRAALVVVAILLSMEAVGIPLGVLSVFGGALGVGLGLGLQRIASNYVSGFIILLDRSLRIGDLITVDKYHGKVSQIRTRYTVVQALDGTEAIIPNEQLVSNPVINTSFTTTKLRVTVKLVVMGDADLDRALGIMQDAAARQERVLKDPAPTAMLSAFAADGLELELGIWVADPASGTGQLRSDIGRFILSEFGRAGISLAAPQREVRLTVPAGVAVHAPTESPASDPSEPSPKS